MSEPAHESIRIVRSLPAAPQRVFEAWTEADRFAGWAWGSLGRDTRAVLEPWVGGRYRVTTQGDDGECSFHGEVVELQGSTRLVYTLHWDAPMGYDVGEERITVELAGTEGGCEMTFVHDGVAIPAARREHERGWNNAFDHLERQLSG